MKFKTIERKVNGSDFSRKRLIFNENEQEKYNLESEYEVKTTLYGKFLRKDKPEFAVNFGEVSAYLYPTNYKNYVTIEIVLENQNETLKFDGSMRSREQSAEYKMLKKAAIFYSNYKKGNEVENKIKDTEVNEETYISRRTSMISKSDENTIGDILTNEDLIEDCKMMAEFLNESQIIDEIEDIKFDGRLRTSAGNIGIRRNRITGEVVGLAEMKVNPKLPNNDKGIDEYFNTIKHELAHAITKEGDSSPIFKEYCNDRDIRLSHNIGFGKYKIYCEECGKLLKTQSRKTDKMMIIINNPGYTCNHCGSGDFRLEVEED
ncbi:MAG: hypothetical protein ACQEQF_00150 [Bacillota bacterium]